MDAFNLSDLTVTSVCSATTLYHDAGAGVMRMNRPRWALAIKYEGETVYNGGGVSVLSNANHLALLPEGSSYTWRCLAAGHCAIVEFDAEAPAGARMMSLPVRNCQKVLRLAETLARKMAFPEPCGQLICKKLLYEMLCEAARGGARSYVSGSSRQRLQPALEYIADHYDRPMSNDALAQLTGYSTVHFRKLFTELYGVSPMAYVQEMRIEKAKAALGSDYGTIGAIAQALGYASIYDFSRAFKRRTGLSPSAYARREE